MVCIYCGGDTKVINSRGGRKSPRTWRRRQCLLCNAVFTTDETVDLESSIRVIKTPRHLEPFSADKLFFSIYESLSHRKSAREDARQLSATVVSCLVPCKTGKLDISEIKSTVLEVLKRFDKAAATYYRVHNLD